MKQQIIIEQWNELTKKQKVIWYDFLKYKFLPITFIPEREGFVKGMFSIKEGDIFYRNGLNQNLILPTIGQMIAFLDEDNIPRIIPILPDLWRVDANLLDEFEASELCDALWNACKCKISNKSYE